MECRRLFCPGRLGVIALLAGLGGAGLAWFLHEVVHLIYGTRSETLPAIEANTAARQRFLVITAAGVVMALLWWAIRKWGPHPPNPEQAAAGASMSPGWTIAEALIEVANVGAGASIGRESAPREVGAMAADRLSGGLDCTPMNGVCSSPVPLGQDSPPPITYRSRAPSSASKRCSGFPGCARHRSGISRSSFRSPWAFPDGAVFAGRLVVPHRHLYTVDYPNTGSFLSLLVLAAILGLVLGPLGYALGRLFTMVTKRGPKANRLLLVMPVGYLAVAALAAWQPAIMGNGKLLAQGAFDWQLGTASLILLIMLKPIATALTMGSGARGGRITPSFSTGAAAGHYLLGAVFSVVHQWRHTGGRRCHAGHLHRIAISGDFTLHRDDRRSLAHDPAGGAGSAHCMGMHNCSIASSGRAMRHRELDVRLRMHRQRWGWVLEWPK